MCVRLLCALFALLLSSVAVARTPVRVCAETSPLTVGCLVSAAEMYGVPVSALLAILDVEGGTVGYEERNRNGTADLGPAQINTVHLPELTRLFGVTRESVAGNGCLNIHLAALLLRRHLDAENGDIYAAIGNYHSRRSPYRERYQRKIREAYTALKIAPEQRIPAILRKANSNGDG